MKKLFTLLCLLFTMMSQTVLASVPQQIAYQIMVLDPATGKIKVNANVAIKVEVRQGGEHGTAVFSKDFNVQTDKHGTCNLMLDIPAEMDWSKGDYYFATLVDGKETGVAKMASVPFALCAQTLSGVITPAELIGTWDGEEPAASLNDSHESDGIARLTYTFKKDGTGTLYQKEVDGRYETIIEGTFSWTLTPTGMLLLTDYKLKETENRSTRPEEPKFKHVKPWYTPVVKVGEGKCFFTAVDQDRQEGVVLTKK